MLGAKTYPPVSLNLSSFGQESCGRQLCRDCDSDHTHPDKQRVAEHFFAYFKEALKAKVERQ